MKQKWNELTKSEKIHYIFAFVLGLASLVFIILDLCTEWKPAHLGWCITFGLCLVSEAKANWNKDRKIAILNLVIAVTLIVVNLITTIL